MPIKMTLGIADGVVEISGDREQDLIKQAAFWMSLPKKCPMCESEIIFTYRTPKGNTYYGLKCIGKPSHECDINQQKPEKGGGLYYPEKPEWKLAYGENGQSPAKAENKSAQQNNVTPIRAAIQKLDDEAGLTAKDFDINKARTRIRELSQRIVDMGGKPTRPSHIPAKKTLEDYNKAETLALLNAVKEQYRTHKDVQIEQDEREAIATA